MKVVTADKVRLLGGLQGVIFKIKFFFSFSLEGMLRIKFDGHIEHNCIELFERCLLNGIGNLLKGML